MNNQESKKNTVKLEKIDSANFNDSRRCQFLFQQRLRHYNKIKDMTILWSNVFQGFAVAIG
jgi:hypothetical protein